MSEEGILFHTDYTAEKVKFSVKDGKTVINDKEFIIDRVQPIDLKKKRFGRTVHIPFYILKWDKVEPVSIQLVEVEIDGKRYAEMQPANTIKSLEVVFPDKAEGDVLPEMLRETHDMRYMKHLKKYAADGTGGKKFAFQRWMLVPIALILAGLMMFLINGGRFI